MSVSQFGPESVWPHNGYMTATEVPTVGSTITTSASALVGIVREVVAHDTTPNLYRVRITVDAGTPDEFDKWTMVRVGSSRGTILGKPIPADAPASVAWYADDRG
jgi:hypothetical protein